jgi:predicted Zn-dependent protease
MWHLKQQQNRTMLLTQIIQVTEQFLYSQRLINFLIYLEACVLKHNIIYFYYLIIVSTFYFNAFRQDKGISVAR